MKDKLKYNIPYLKIENKFDLKFKLTTWFIQI